MFSKNKKNSEPSTTPKRLVPSIIGADLKIEGNLISAGELQIDGAVIGDISAKILLVGQTASINGAIHADTVRVHGTVNGQIKAKFVNLAKTAHVIGDIMHENLSIQEGAFLDGRMSHMSEQEVLANDKSLAETNNSINGVTAAAGADGTTGNAKLQNTDRVNLLIDPSNKEKNDKNPKSAKPSPTTVAGSQQSTQTNVQSNVQSNVQPNVVKS